MDNGLLLVNFGSLSQASGDIASALSQLQTRLAEVKRDGDKLAETWQGTAKSAYYERQRKWEAAADDLTIILRQIQGALDESKNDFHDTERRATNRFQ